MKPATPKTGISTLSQLRKVVFGGSPISSLRIFIHTLALFFLLTLVLRSVFWLKNWPMWQTLTAGEFARAVGYGLRFDLSIAAMMMCAAFLLHGLFWLMRVRRRGWSLFRLLPGIALVLMMAGDAMYFDEASKHIGYEIHNVHGDWAALLATALRAHPGLLFVHLAIGGGFALWLFWQDRRRFALSAPLSTPIKTLSLWREIFSGAICAALAVVMFRGGFQPIPLNPASAFTLGNPLQAAVALNGAYAIVQGFAHPNRFVSLRIPAPTMPNADAELAKLYPPPTVTERMTNRANVVVILLEGWAAKYMRSYFGQHDSTPFFDSLRERSLSSDVLLADGNRTSMGMFAIFCSYQNPLGQAVSKTRL